MYLFCTETVIKHLEKEINVTLWSILCTWDLFADTKKLSFVIRRWRLEPKARLGTGVLTARCSER